MTTMEISSIKNKCKILSHKKLRRNQGTNKTHSSLMAYLPLQRIIICKYIIANKSKCVKCQMHFLYAFLFNTIAPFVNLWHWSQRSDISSSFTLVLLHQIQVHLKNVQLFKIYILDQLWNAWTCIIICGRLYRNLGK